MDFKNTIHNNIKMCQALRDWLERRDFNFFITANFNRRTSFTAGRKALGKWQDYMNGAILGNGWRQNPVDKHLFYVAIPEHPKSNLHYHMLLKAPVNPQKFLRLANDKWQRIISNGDLHIAALDSADDIRRVAKYSTKDLWNGVGLDELIVSE